MMKNITGFLLIVVMCVVTLTAHASVATSVGKEVVEQGAKVITKIIVREGTEEVTEQAARRTLQAAIKKSPQVAKMSREVGEDALLYVLRSSAARKLVSRYGDDAAEVLLRHGKVGGELLEFVPSAAKSVKNLSKEQIRWLVSLKRAGKITVGAAKYVIEWTARHPLAATYILSPKVRAAVSALLDVINTITSTAAEHPMWTLLLVAVLCLLIWLFRADIKAGILAMLTFPFRLFRRRRKEASPQDSGGTGKASAEGLSR